MSRSSHWAIKYFYLNGIRTRDHVVRIEVTPFYTTKAKIWEFGEYSIKVAVKADLLHKK